MAFGIEATAIRLSEETTIARQPGLVERLHPAAQERVRAHGEIRFYARGETLFAQGDPHAGIAVIESGLVRSFYASPSGREITLAYWQPGNFVGGPDVFGGGLHMWSAVAARRTAVLFLPGAGLRDLARDVPDLALQIIDALSFKARCYSSLAQMLGTRSLTQRLAQLLLHLAHTYGFEETDGPEITVAAAFTHAEIANLIGSTRQWVTIGLNRLQKAGVLTHRRGLLLILRADVLSFAAAKDD